MSDTESLTVRLEDGEIDESNELSVLSEPMTESGNVRELRLIVKDIRKADMAQNYEHRPTHEDFEAADKSNKQKQVNSQEVYLNDQEIGFIDEDEMLFVRGASPAPFVVERLSYSRKSSPQDCDGISFDTTPKKKRRTSGKRRRKRATPRKIVKDNAGSSDDHTKLGKSNSKERSQSPEETRDKLPQLCKFYLQDCCAKRFKCEYMHSEFPCKFYYMGLKCEDETSETKCKLSHGGPLSAEMCNTLARHINNAPIDVLGQEFVDLRAKMQVGEINQMLQEMQNNLTTLKNVPEEISSPRNESSKFVDTLKEILYFLNEDQLNGLQKFEIAKVDDLLNLTLAQLNSIGIHAIQIEAIQMSFVAGQDTDMRKILPTPLEVPVQQTIPRFEVVCYNDGNTCGQNWYEEEEVPLVIDETKEAKTPDEDDIIIDVVGYSNTDSNESIPNEDEIDKIEHEVAIVSTTDFTDQPHHFVIEETQEGLQVLPNSTIFVDKFPPRECTETIVKINQKDKVVLEKIEELQEEIQLSKNHDEAHIDEDTNELEVLHASEKLKETIQCQKHQEEFQFDGNANELEVVRYTPEDFQEEMQYPKNQDESQIYKNLKDLKSLQTSEESQEKNRNPQNENDPQLDTKDTTENLSVVIEKQIEKETLRVDETQIYIHSPTQVIKQDNINQEDEKSNSPSLPLVPLGGNQETRSPKENKPLSENVVAEIDLTVLTPPRSSRELPLPVRFKIEPKQEYINPFQKNITPPHNETKQFYFPFEDLKKNFKQDHQMQGDNSSEDWDADERSDIQSPPKEIASPDQSEDESTPFVADGTCPELPRRTRNLDNYQPALEINAYITYPPMEYKLYEIYMPEYEVNKPTLMEKLLKANSTDPRLKKFIEKEKNHGVFPQAEYSFFPPNISKCDPRLRTGTSCQDQYYNTSRVLYSYLQRSHWYQELKSNLKIQINHSVSDLVRALNYFHKDPSPQKIFDLFQIECAGVLLEVMRNVGIFIDVKGNITEEANYKQLCAPLQQQQPPQTFGNVSGCIGPQTKPGLLGFAPPGVPHPQNNNSQMSSENSFARQAFGNDCFCSNKNNDFQPIGPTFYVGGRYTMNRNQEPNFDAGFEPVSYQRQPQKRHFKRR